MKVSLNIAKQFTDIDLSVDELVAKINAQLGGVDEVIDLKDVYKDAVIVKVVECEKHPDADRLNVTKIDDGGVVEDVARDENGLVQVVCGAPNVTAGMFAVWLPPRSVVPATYHDEEPFVLGARELRGVMSQGMLAAADELGIGNDHEGILTIDQNEWKPNDVAIEPGVNFAQVYGLDDYIIDIENKMFTHRPDLFGQLGVAREIAGIQGKQFTSPDWYQNIPEFTSARGLELTAFNEATEKAPRTMFVAMNNVTIKPSPLWLQAALVAMGSKPINNVVDVTNYIMLLTAQPTHAYDYDKIRGHTIGARMAQEGESIELLNGKTYQLTTDDVVIADGEGAIGLAGIMGGGNSEVSAETTNIILEVANFDMYAVRKSSMRHGIFTDALTRFNKGQSALQNSYIMNLLMASVKDVSSAEQASEVFDIGDFNDRIDHDGVHVVDSLSITSKFINERLGLELSDEQIAELLSNVQLKVQIDSKGLEVFAPYWRTDLELPEDIVEEVGRLYGFDNLPQELPSRPIYPAKENQTLKTKTFVRQTLSSLGANEVLTYSFVHEKLLSRVGQCPEYAYKLSNALSPDLQYYRLSLMPSLLDKVHMNIKNRYDKFGLFELGKTHFKGEMDENEPTVPREDNRVAAIFVANDKSRPVGAAYYQAKKYLEKLTSAKLVPLVEIDLESDELTKSLVSAYAPTRSAVIIKDSKVCGVIGEFKPEVAKAFKLPSYTAGFEIGLDLVDKEYLSYRALSRFPSVTQDLSLQVLVDTSVESVFERSKQILDTLDAAWHYDVEVISIYQADESDTKTITLRFVITNYERSLVDSEVSAILSDLEATIYSL